MLGLSGILIFLFAIPGFITRRFYYSGEYYKQYSSSKIVLATFWSLIVGALVSIPSVYIYNGLHPFFDTYIVNQEILSNYYCWVFEESNSESLSLSLIASVFNTSHVKSFLAFTATFLLVSGFTGFSAKYLVRRLYLDMFIKFLRFQNYWSYYLRGKELFFKRHAWASLDYGTYISIVQNISENELIKVEGFLHSYELNPINRELDVVVLDSVAITCKEEETQNLIGTSSSTYQPMTPFVKAPTVPIRDEEGSLIVVPYNQVKSISIHLVTRPKEYSQVLITTLKIFQPFALIFLLISPFIFFTETFSQDPYLATLGIGLGILLMQVANEFKKIIIKLRSSKKQEALKLFAELGHFTLGLAAMDFLALVVVYLVYRLIDLFRYLF